MTKPRTILVVDDESDTCANLSDILTDMGFSVDAACDGFQALELVRARRYDVALLDLKMPGMDGLELYRRIKELRAETVAIIVTAYASDATAKEALDAGAWRILSKPVDLQRLLQHVEHAMGQPLVMIIDDDSDLCDALWDVLREHGFRAAVAQTVGEAAQGLRHGELQVALIDMRLPEGDGHEVFDMVRKTNPQARTVVITGHRSETEELVSRVMAAGADAVCYKPFDLKTLIDTIKTLADSTSTSSS